MRYDLVRHIRPELVQRIQGTTDSEWIYALVLSQLEDPFARPETRELADAAGSALRLLREVRTQHGIDTSSPVNLCLTTGQSLVATRFSFDYGWYPDEDALLETDLPYVSLWYTVGGEYVARDEGSASDAELQKQPVRTEIRCAAATRSTKRSSITRPSGCRKLNAIVPPRRSHVRGPQTRVVGLTSAWRSRWSSSSSHVPSACTRAEIVSMPIRSMCRRPTSTAGMAR
jgi:hypothetical protein